MWRPLLLVSTLAVSSCSSELPAPGPGFPDQVRSIRLYDGAGVDRTNHVLLFLGDTLHLEVRLFAGDGQYLLEIRGGVAMTITFSPPSIASSTPVSGETLIHAVTTNAPTGTLGSLTVTLEFLDDGSIKSFGPFECLVH